MGILFEDYYARFESKISKRQKRIAQKNIQKYGATAKLAEHGFLHPALKDKRQTKQFNARNSISSGGLSTRDSFSDWSPISSQGWAW